MPTETETGVEFPAETPREVFEKQAAPEPTASVEPEAVPIVAAPIVAAPVESETRPLQDGWTIEAVVAEPEPIPAPAPEPAVIGYAATGPLHKPELIAQAEGKQQ